MFPSTASDTWKPEDERGQKAGRPRKRRAAAPRARRARRRPPSPPSSSALPSVWGAAALPRPRVLECRQHKLLSNRGWVVRARQLGPPRAARAIRRLATC
jgi:hypothetical protein